MRVFALATFVALAPAGCGDKGSPPGPSGSTVLGNLAVAETPGADTTRDGILVAARSGGRESTDLTDSSGSFFLGDAPTGEISVVFRRGGCGASLPLGAVVSMSSLTLIDVSYSCPQDPGNVSASNIAETFQAVVRRDPSGPSADLELCVRVGNDDRNRTVPLRGASIVDENDRTTTSSALRANDLVEIDGDRSAPGGGFTFDTLRVRILDRDIADVCDDDPFT